MLNMILKYSHIKGRHAPRPHPYNDMTYTCQLYFLSNHREPLMKIISKSTLLCVCVFLSGVNYCQLHVLSLHHIFSSLQGTLYVHKTKCMCACIYMVFKYTHTHTNTWSFHGSYQPQNGQNSKLKYLVFSFWKIESIFVMMLGQLTLQREPLSDLPFSFSLLLFLLKAHCSN